MAASHQVVITLTALNSPDEFRKRVITLTPALTNIQIGRSSKSEFKNLTAARDNAWFDNPVMSREHAEIWISPSEPRVVYLKDVGSMHGTYVLDIRLGKNVPHRLHNGDRVTFGIQVTRAQETFSAQVFRVHLEWQEWIPPTPESNPPTKSIPNVTQYAMPENSPDAELSHEPSPSIRFHCPSSRDSSMPKSDSSVAGSDLINFGLEDFPQMAEESPSPRHVRLQAPTDLAKEGRVTDQDAYSHMIRIGHNDPYNAARDAAGNSEHNPIQLDNDIRVQDVVVDESDDDAPEVVSSLRVCDLVRPEEQAVLLPLGYVLETASFHGQPKTNTANVGNVSDQFEVAEMSDEDDLECINEAGTDQITGNPEKECKVYQSTSVELDEEDEDASSSVAETEDEVIVPSQSSLTKGRKVYIREGSADHSDTLRLKSDQDLWVDDTQYQIQGVPERCTSPILDGGYGNYEISPSHDGAAPRLSKLSERAPSPSDAAMAKTSSVKHSQLARGPIARYDHGQNRAWTVQSTHNDKPVSISNQMITSTEGFVYPTPLNPLPISTGTSRGITWQALDKDQTHYSDGPSRNDANRATSSFGHAGNGPNARAQDTASISQNSRGEDAHLLYHEDRTARTYDRFFDDEVPRQAGHKDLPADPDSHNSTNRLGSAMSFAAFASTSESDDESDPLATINRGKPQVSTGDIVETHSGRSSSLVLGSKRKADEISTDQNGSSSSLYMSQSRETVSTPYDFCIPDAQPRDVSELVSQLKSTQSTESSVGPSCFTVSTAIRDQRPKKRMKTVAKWIGTTILLGVSAVVTIAATAPQSVWDEIDREMGLA